MAHRKLQHRCFKNIRSTTTQPPPQDNTQPRRRRSSRSRTITTRLRSTQHDTYPNAATPKGETQICTRTTARHKRHRSLKQQLQALLWVCALLGLSQSVQHCSQRPLSTAPHPLTLDLNPSHHARCWNCTDLQPQGKRSRGPPNAAPQPGQIQHSSRKPDRRQLLHQTRRRRVQASGQHRLTSSPPTCSAYTDCNNARRSRRSNRRSHNTGPLTCQHQRRKPRARCARLHSTTPATTTNTPHNGHSPKTTNSATIRYLTHPSNLALPHSATYTSKQIHSHTKTIQHNTIQLLPKDIPYKRYTQTPTATHRRSPTEPTHTIIQGHSYPPTQNPNNGRHTNKFKPITTPPSPNTQSHNYTLRRKSKELTKVAHPSRQPGKVSQRNHKQQRPTSKKHPQYPKSPTTLHPKLTHNATTTTNATPHNKYTHPAYTPCLTRHYHHQIHTTPPYKPKPDSHQNPDTTHILKDITAKHYSTTPKTFTNTKTTPTTAATRDNPLLLNKAIQGTNTHRKKPSPPHTPQKPTHQITPFQSKHTYKPNTQPINYQKTHHHIWHHPQPKTAINDNRNSPHNSTHHPLLNTPLHNPSHILFFVHICPLSHCNHPHSLPLAPTPPAYVPYSTLDFLHIPPRTLSSTQQHLPTGPSQLSHRSLHTPFSTQHASRTPQESPSHSSCTNPKTADHHALSADSTTELQYLETSCRAITQRRKSSRDTSRQIASDNLDTQEFCPTSHELTPPNATPQDISAPDTPSAHTCTQLQQISDHLHTAKPAYCLHQHDHTHNQPQLQSSPLATAQPCMPTPNATATSDPQDYHYMPATKTANDRIHQYYTRRRTTNTPDIQLRNCHPNLQQEPKLQAHPQPATPTRLQPQLQQHQASIHSNSSPRLPTNTLLPCPETPQAQHRRHTQTEGNLPSPYLFLMENTDQPTGTQPTPTLKRPVQRIPTTSTRTTANPVHVPTLKSHAAASSTS